MTQKALSSKIVLSLMLHEISLLATPLRPPPPLPYKLFYGGGEGSPSTPGSSLALPRNSASEVVHPEAAVVTGGGGCVGLGVTSLGDGPLK